MSFGYLANNGLKIFLIYPAKRSHPFGLSENATLLSTPRRNQQKINLDFLLRVSK